MALWKTYIENVEPICKLLHIPSTSKVVEMVSRDPETASNADECLVFAIYHFAVFSMTEDDCNEVLGQQRDALLRQYHFATRQALANVSFLKTTKMTVLRALILFLMSSRFSYDSQTYWVLTGVAVRISQRMGLHRDGQELGLPPFEVEMRRRLFYQLLPLDGIACQMAGTGVTIPPDSWDTRPPLNINDDQIWPGMPGPPQEQKGSTDMIFVLARLCVGKRFAKAGKPLGPPQFENFTDAEKFINEAEEEVEEKYVRYCDVINPLHFLAMVLARAGITSMRLRIRLLKAKDQTATYEERREMFQLAMRQLDTDAAMHRHEGLNKYKWHVRPISVWGTWDSLIFVLTTLLKGHDLLSASEFEAAWGNIEKIYANHDELLESERALYLAFKRFTLKAWDARPPYRQVLEPVFIASLRSPRRRRKSPDANAPEPARSTMLPTDPSPSSDTDPSSESLSDVLGLDMGDGFNLDDADWLFWDQLVQNHQ